MIDRDQLEQAAREALAYVGAQPDVREAEVFVASNGLLLTRLNYTSHIPSNGVEEPKSTDSYGIGIRVALDSPEGVLTGFGSEAADISLEGARSALEKARKSAVLDPEFVSLPRPGTEGRTLSGYHDPEIMEINDEGLVDAGWRVTGGAVRSFLNSEALAIAAGDPKRLAEMGLIVSGDVTILQERVAIASTQMPEAQSDESSLVLSFVTAMVEREEAKGSGYGASVTLADLTDEAGREAAEAAVQAMGGVRVPTGDYRVVFGRQAVTDLINNLVLPSLHLSTFYMSGSPFQGKLGQRVASEVLTIIDDGARPGLVGSKGITCEGLPTGRTELIKDGVLVGTLANWYEQQRILLDPEAKEKLGVDPRDHAEAIVPRNGFRFGTGGGRHFDSPPGVAATNVLVQGPGERDLDDLLREVVDGVYVGRIWYTYPINGLRAGDFTCTIVGDSFLIRDGKLAEPVKPNTIRINDNILTVLNGILGITKQASPTLVWAADEIVYAPDMAVENVHLEAIAGFMQTGM